MNTEDIKNECDMDSTADIKLCIGNTGWLNEVKEEPMETMDYTRPSGMLKDPKQIRNVENAEIDVSYYLFTDKLVAKKKYQRMDMAPEFIHSSARKHRTTTSNHNFLECEGCGGKSERYCTKCFVLKRILNNNAKIGISKPKLTIPRNILQLNQTIDRSSIVALQTIPKEVEFGPFDGLESVLTMTQSAWKIKNGKLIVEVENAKFSNWMQFVNCARTSSEANLSVFEYNDCLYYKCERVIKKNEELLIYFGDQHSSCLKDDVETYLSPAIVTDIGNIYACGVCCLGFSSELYLAKHKLVCLNGTRIYLTTDDIVRCSFCKIYFEEKEYSSNHVNYCCEKYARKYLSSTESTKALNENQSVVKYQLKKIYNVVGKKHKCEQCPYQTNDQHDLKKHQLRHANIKPFECTTCKKRFTQKGHLKLHVKNQHVAVTDKEYKCRFCAYQTNSKGDLKLHLYVHDTIKRFECEICGKRFRQKANLQVHLKNLHLAVDNKKFACTKCEFRTNYKNSLDKHVNNTHDDVTPVACRLCNSSFKQEQTLKQHIKYKHAPPAEKEFKCPACPYQAKRKGCLKRHLSIHNDDKSYGCTNCDYRTNCKNNLRHHMYRHAEAKPFSCERCGNEFARKGALKAHIRSRHARDEKT